MSSNIQTFGLIWIARSACNALQISMQKSKIKHESILTKMIYPNRAEILPVGYFQRLSASALNIDIPVASRDYAGRASKRRLIPQIHDVKRIGCVGHKGQQKYDRTWIEDVFYHVSLHFGSDLSSALSRLKIDTCLWDRLVTT